MKCPICDSENDLNECCCHSCGWVFKKNKSEAFRLLEDNQIEIQKTYLKNVLKNKKRLQEIQETISSIDGETDKIKKQVDKCLNQYEKDVKLLRKKEQILIEKEKELGEISEFEKYCEVYDKFIKSYFHQGVGGKYTGFISKKIITINVPSASNHPPEFMLVIGKNKMNRSTKNAWYFINLIKYLKKKERNLWVCDIPNPLKLKGKYYGFLFGNHLEGAKQLKIVCDEKLINFI